MPTLSIVIPCYDEECTLRECVDCVLDLADDRLALEVIIVDDASRDGSLRVARELAETHPEIRVFSHECNQGKGAALRTGFKEAKGDFVAVQDADLEYDPQDLKRLLTPLIAGEADVVFGSRFLSPDAHRVLFFWHMVTNKILTLISNMFTDLNLTDMEVGYKVFRRDVIQQIEIQENRFGFEPEIVAKVAHLRLRIYEMGISYRGRTYEEGKKIGFKDGLRALYCIFRYNAHWAPVPIQFLIYLMIGGLAAIVNLAIFLGLYSAGWPVEGAAPTAFAVAAMVNYLLCISVLFRHRARWNTFGEIVMFAGVVCAIGGVDLLMTKSLLSHGISAGVAKLTATVVGVTLNFLGRKFLVFPERPSGSWKPQGIGHSPSLSPFTPLHAEKRLPDAENESSFSRDRVIKS